jgi:glutamate-1-semialdehyde 2,1-aminomutase
VETANTGYGIQTARSRRISERLARSIPGGNTRSLAYFPPYPLAIASGSGCRIRDADGNEFVDLLNNYTASVHGHAVPAINEAMTEQAALGTVFPAPSELQAELAERIIGRVASVEKLRFANSGTEAVMMAVRAARAFTGCEKIVKAEGGYDGMWEQVPMSRPDDSDPYRAAMPEGVRELVRMVDFNDVGGLEAAMEQEGHGVAAILLEPVTGTGVFEGTAQYFSAARRLEKMGGAIKDSGVVRMCHANAIAASTARSKHAHTRGEEIPMVSAWVTPKSKKPAVPASSSPPGRSSRRIVASSSGSEILLGSTYTPATRTTKDRTRVT